MSSTTMSLFALVFSVMIALLFTSLYALVGLGEGNFFGVTSDELAKLLSDEDSETGAREPKVGGRGLVDEPQYDEEGMLIRSNVPKISYDTTKQFEIELEGRKGYLVVQYDSKYYDKVEVVQNGEKYDMRVNYLGTSADTGVPEIIVGFTDHEGNQIIVNKENLPLIINEEQGIYDLGDSLSTDFLDDSMTDILSDELSDDFLSGYMMDPGDIAEPYYRDGLNDPITDYEQIAKLVMN